MWDGLDDLAFFVAAARAGGVRAAAARLSVPRSTVSRRLAALERRLGVALLRRGGASLALTDVGGAYFERVAGVVDAAEALVGELSGQAVRARGTLRVAASAVFAEEFLAPVVERYAREQPEVRVELHLAVERLDLRAHRIDVAFRTTPLRDADDFTSVRLGESVNGFFASPPYVRARGRPRHPSDLAGHDLVAVGEPGRRLAWRYREGGHEKALAVRPRVLASSFTFAQRACAAGVGVVRLPSFLVGGAVQRGELEPLLEPYWHHSWVHAVFPLGVASSRKTRAFVEASQQVLTAERLAPAVAARASRGRRAARSGEAP
jgi:DNA-binding transcriptional LysR family regulator